MDMDLEGPDRRWPDMPLIENPDERLKIGVQSSQLAPYAMVMISDICWEWKAGIYLK